MNHLGYAYITGGSLGLNPTPHPHNNELGYATQLRHRILIHILYTYTYKKVLSVIVFLL